MGPAAPRAGPAAVEGWPAARRPSCRSTPPKAAGCISSRSALVDDALAARAQGFGGAKIKVGRPHARGCRAAVRGARGGRRRLRDHDRRQPGLHGRPRRSAAPACTSRSTSPGSRSRCRPTTSAAMSRLSAHHAADRGRRSRSTILSHFREYLQRGACSIVQADVARIGGITPWLKVAHLAEAFNIAGLPAFPDGAARRRCPRRCRTARWVEYIPQLDDITTSRMRSRMAAPCRPTTRPRHRLGLAGHHKAAGVHAGRADRVSGSRSARPSDRSWYRPPAPA